ncbi:MAG: TonB-dependent receptor [Bacteroidota bacterium]
MNRKRKWVFQLTYRWVMGLLFFGSLPLSAQVSINGQIVDEQGQALEGAVVSIKTVAIWTTSDRDGRFSIDDLPLGQYELTVQILGYEIQKRAFRFLEENTVDVEIEMRSDPLDLTGVIVTGILDQQSKIDASLAISTLNSKSMRLRGARGTADLLRAVPGTFVDAAAGEMFTRVYSRGIASSAEDDHGWFYVGLQEDGLPVAATQHTFYSPDLFHRVDLTTSRLEAIRGGSAAITSLNTPGGVFNFISKQGTPNFTGTVQSTTALQGAGNPLYRLDVNLGGPLPMEGWTYNLGGFYRYDNGPRNTDFNWGNGGQIKVNLIKQYQQGHLRLFAKFLNDKVNRYQALAASNWEDPQAAFGQDFNTSAVSLPRVSTAITNGQALNMDPMATRNFATNNGVLARDIAFGFEVFHQFNSGWSLRNQFKLSSKKADWQTSIGSQRIGLDNFLTYFFAGGGTPWQQVVFRDANTDETLARVNNIGSPGFEYLEGSLPNDGILGSAPWQKEDSGRDIMYQMTLSKDFKKHRLNAQLFASHTAVETYTVGSFAFATFENEPRMLRVSLENPGAAVEQLSDATGTANYGGLFYNAARADVSQVALALEERWQATEQLTFDLGLRMELVSHLGEKERSQADSRVGGIDGDTLTVFDNNVLAPFGRPDPFRFNYSYLSSSLGINYQLNDQLALFTRFTNGNKAPELSYYFNSFANLPINIKGKVQRVWQGELGLKLSSSQFNIFATGFWSRLSNISFAEFVFDQTGGGLFYTPEQINQTTTFGLELEANWSPFQNFDLRFVATLQDPKATVFTVYDANRTATNTDDDEVIDYSGNDLPHNPKIAFELTPSYRLGRHRVFASYRYLGERQANIANAFQLPAFGMLSAGIDSRITRQLNATLIINNLLNSAGLMNFFGPNEFGSNASAVTPEFVEQNPDATFMVVPVLPRTILLKLAYDF